MFALLRRAPAARLACRSRYVSTPRPRFASYSVLPPGVDAAKLAALQSSPLFKKIKENPAALEAVAKFAEVMQKNGVFFVVFLGVLEHDNHERTTGFDTTAGQPSMLQMSKMFLNADVRNAAKGLSDAFAAAGVDLKDKVRGDTAGEHGLRVHGVLIRPLMAGRGAAVGRTRKARGRPTAEKLSAGLHDGHRKGHSESTYNVYVVANAIRRLNLQNIKRY